MINDLMKAFTKNKHAIVIAIAVLAVLAYAVPYGMDVEAKHGGAHPNPPGKSEGYGYGLSCEHFGGQGPIRCR